MWVVRDARSPEEIPEMRRIPIFATVAPLRICVKTQRLPADRGLHKDAHNQGIASRTFFCGGRLVNDRKDVIAVGSVYHAIGMANCGDQLGTASKSMGN